MSAEDTAEDDRRQLREKTQAIAKAHMKVQIRDGHCGLLSTDPPLVSGTVLSIAADRALENNLGWTVGDDNTLTCHIPAGMLPNHKMSADLDPSAVKQSLEDSVEEFAYTLWLSCIFNKEKTQIAYTVGDYNQMVSRTLRRLENPYHLETLSLLKSLNNLSGDQKLSLLKSLDDDQRLSLVESLDQLEAQAGNPTEDTEYTVWQSDTYKDLEKALSQQLQGKQFTQIFKGPQGNPKPQYKSDFGKPVHTTQIPTFETKTLDNFLFNKAVTVATHERKLERSHKLESLTPTEQNRVSTYKTSVWERLGKHLSDYKNEMSILKGGGLYFEHHFQVSKDQQKQSGKGDTHNTGQMYILGRDLHESALGELGKKLINPFQVQIQVDESTYDHNKAVLAEARPIVEYAKSKCPELDWTPTDEYYVAHPSG